MQWEITTYQGSEEVPESSLAPNQEFKIKEGGPPISNSVQGPLPMSFDEKKGWTYEPFGPTSRYQKRMAREVKSKAAHEGMSPLKTKHEGPIQFQELDPSICDLKCRKGSKKHNQNPDSEKQMEGGGCRVAPPSQMSVIAQNSWGLGSSLMVRTLIEEVRAKDPLLVFLLETKARVSRIKGIQNKIEFTQGIMVPSDGRSGSLALLSREGTNVRFKSYSNFHINLEIHENSSLTPWRATGFYGQSDATRGFTSWQLLEVLKRQNHLSWVVFSDFNEITHSAKNQGGQKEMQDK